MVHKLVVDVMPGSARSKPDPIPAPRTPRFLLRGQGAVPSAIDGVWYPWNTDILTELRTLIAAVSLRIGSVTRIAFAWDTVGVTRVRIDEGDGIEIRGPYPGQPSDLVYLDSASGCALALMVIPPYTDPERGNVIMQAIVDPLKGDAYRVQ
ncbi:DUF5994 family protein [Rhodococcus sp. 27YEA15]|uniref:DUF5994 family protein n=1 Tax=Rhodococcus sp. 27YEA15 TaxID=3156259 RepID=UPI003C7D97D0